MPRSETPRAHSIFDLLEEKHPRSPGRAPSVTPPARRVTPQARPVDTALDGGSRSLLLASLLAVLATALVTLSLKPDLPSTIGDAPPVLAPRPDAEPTSEIGLPRTAAEPDREDAAHGREEARPPRPPAPAAVATLTLARPAVPEPGPRRDARPLPQPMTGRPATTEPAAVEPPPVAEPATAAPVKPEPTRLEPETETVTADAERTPSPGPDLRPRELPTAPSRPTPAADRQPADPPATAPAPAAAAEIHPPVRLATPLPSYTREAWVAGVQGDVLVRARIDKEGTVADVEVLRGLPHGLTEAAVAAVRRWRFRPATVDGVPVSADHDLSIRFAL